MFDNFKRKAMALLLSLAMIITYMPASMIAYAVDGDDQVQVEQQVDAEAPAEEVTAEEPASEETVAPEEKAAPEEAPAEEVASPEEKSSEETAKPADEKDAGTEAVNEARRPKKSSVKANSRQTMTVTTSLCLMMPMLRSRRELNSY